MVDPAKFKGRFDAAKLAPFIIAAVSIVAAGAWLRWQLFQSTYAFEQQFVSGNLSELAAGDTAALSRRLDASGSTLDWTCMEGRKGSSLFFSRVRGPCGTGLFHQEAELGIPGNRDVRIAVTFGLARNAGVTALILVFGQLLLLGLLARASRLTERAKLNAVLEAERAAATANEAIARMSQNLAHDLKNPLIVFDFAARVHGWEEFQSLKDQMARALSTVRAILGAFGKGTGAQVIRPTVCNLDLATMMGDINRLFNSEGFGLQYSGPASTPAFIDAVALERSITNLVRNAKEAGAKRVNVSAKIEGPELTITIADNGPGLPPSVAENLFQRGTTHGKVGGSGIGLFNVKVIAEAHGGKVEHRRKDGETRFLLHLPSAVVPGITSSISVANPAQLRSHAEPAPTPTALLLCLQDHRRQAELLAKFKEAGIPIVTEDKIDFAPLLVYSDFDDVTAKYSRRRVRVIFDDPKMPLEKATKLILLVYRSLLPKENVDES